MALLVICPLCNETFNVKEKYVGKIGGCPHCLGRIAIPSRSPEEETIFTSDDESISEPISEKQATQETPTPNHRDGTTGKTPIVSNTPDQTAEFNALLAEVSLTEPLTSPQDLWTAGPALPQPKKKDNKGLRIIIPLCVGVACSVFVLLLMAVLSHRPASGDNPSNAPAPSSTPAPKQTTLKVVTSPDEWLLKLLAEQESIMDDLVTSLRTVHDADSARAAVPSYTSGMRRQVAWLRSLLDLSPDRAEQLFRPSSDKAKTIASQIERKQEQLIAEKSRVSRIPGAGENLQPPVEPLVVELNQLSEEMERRFPSRRP